MVALWDESCFLFVFFFFFLVVSCGASLFLSFMVFSPVSLFLVILRGCLLRSLRCLFLLRYLVSDFVSFPFSGSSSCAGPSPLFCFFRCLSVLVGPFPHSDLRFPLGLGSACSDKAMVLPYFFSCFLFRRFTALPSSSVGLVPLFLWQAVVGRLSAFFSVVVPVFFLLGPLFVLSFLRILPWAVVSCFSGYGGCVLLWVSLPTSRRAPVLQAVSSVVFLLCLFFFLPSLLWPGLRR